MPKYLKKLIYNIIKYPLILIFLKTPLIRLLKKRFKFHRSNKKNIITLTLDTLFQKEYFDKLESKEEIRELINSTLTHGEGRKWVEGYYNKHFKTLDNLKQNKVGSMFLDEAMPIYNRIINYIKKNELGKNKNVYIIQLGSASGRDLEFFTKIYPELNYISTDINDEILNFQKEKYKNSNLSFFKCHAEEIDKCISYYNLENKILILFSVGSLQYVSPNFLKEFFSKIHKYKSLNLFIGEPISLSFIDDDKKMFETRANTSFSYRYDEYANEIKMNVIEKKIIRPYSKNDPVHKKTGHYYLHSKNSS